MNIEQARLNMVKQQIKAWNVLNEHVLDVIFRTPRENFVPPKYKQLAFADLFIPISDGETMMLPQQEAKILEALNIQPYEKALEIGTGTGYMTALIAQQAHTVVSVDIDPQFLTPAAEKLAALGISNATLTTGNAALGWAHEAPYDVIAITGSLPFLPEVFREQIAVNGRIFAIIGQGHAMAATLLTRCSNTEWEEVRLFETELSPLHEALQHEQFHF